MKKLIIFLGVFLFAFDEKLYEYMFKSFLYSNDLKDAYLVAKKVLKYKNSIVWRKRLARIAWALGKNKEAYENFLYVYKKTHNKKYQKIIFMFPYEKTLLIKKELYEREYRHSNFSHILNLADIYIKEGYPKKAFKILKNAYKKERKENILKKMINIAVSLDDVSLILKHFNDIKNFSFTDRFKVAKILIYYREYKKAYELLKYVKKIPKNLDYYKYLIYVTYKLRKFKEMILLLEYLLEEGKINKGDLDLLLSFYYYKKDYKMLEMLLNKAMKINKVYIKNYIEVLMSEKKYEKAIKTIKKYKNYLDKKDYYFMLGNIYLSLNKIKNAEKFFLKASKYKLNNIEISNLLWFVINYKSKKLFNILKPKINNNFSYQLMLVYFNLGNLNKAYEIGNRILKNNLNNLDFLLSFSDILDTIGYESYFYKLKAWKILNEKLKENKNLLYKKEFFQNYFRLAQIFLSGDEILKLLNIAKKILDNQEYILLKFSYYFNINKEKCFYIYNYKRDF